ncbi:MAG: hypothetical protein MUC33_24160 [Desulfobacterales bacterium]|nr:hypothetical protein [Desulfobacterales bacterium]
MTAMVLFHSLAAAPPAGADFRMSDALTCTVETSTVPADIGRKIALTGLATAAPQVVFENHVRSSMVKLFESEQTLKDDRPIRAHRRRRVPENSRHRRNRQLPPGMTWE